MKVPVRKSMTAAHEAAKVTLPDNFLHQRLKTGISLVSKPRHLWFLNCHYPFFFSLKNKRVSEVCHRTVWAVFICRCGMRILAPTFLATSVCRPKVNRKSLWTRDCDVLMPEESLLDLNHLILYQILTLAANYLQELWGLWVYFYFPAQICDQLFFGCCSRQVGFTDTQIACAMVLL